MHRALRTPAARSLILAAAACLASANSTSNAQFISAPSEQSLSTEAVAPQRFIAAHGRRAIIAGYASDSLEVWAYPFQIVGGYRVAFRTSGATTAINGGEILSRVVYEPHTIMRVYIGPDFIVHEKLFVPLDLPGAILTYSVESSRPVEIEIHAMPILNLMWPAAAGGQSASWNPSLSAFLLSETSNGYSAAIGSPQIIAHDDIGNRTTHGVADTGLGFTIKPDNSGSAHVAIALNAPHAADPGAVFQSLLRDNRKLESEAAAHDTAFRDQVLQVETPDPAVNQAIAWAETALDQAWVCNPDLGCGYIAGYGPSRGARRPQYDWFFGGDGLIAAEAALAMGDHEHARDEFEFIFHYQDPKTGMIWHELSQSASFLDWTGKYPYMFVHVDITFQFLGALGRYAEATGDVDFLKQHWPAIESAYRYCRTVIDPSTGLPRIPADKEGGNEQDRMSDDLGLSTSWVEAASAFAQLATLIGHADIAKEAEQASQQARAAIPLRYWSGSESFWINGHTLPGQPMSQRRSSPTEALILHLFNDRQNESLLDQIASSSFQTSWGTRGVATGSAGFNPESYASGSVSALHTAGVASAFWSQHRPVTALAVWRSLLPWNTLDSLGHMHEVLAGNFYHAQVESVPEQTWSSAGYIDATIHGLLGLETKPAGMTFAPHLPPEWDSISIAHINAGSASGIALALHRNAIGITLQIDNPGSPFPCVFAPELPLGASLGHAYLNQQKIAAKLEQHPQETDARVTFSVPHGSSELRLEIQGGVSILADASAPALGEPDQGIHVIGAHLEGTALTINADVPTGQPSHLQLKTTWRSTSAQGATLAPAGPGMTSLIFPAAPDSPTSNPYRRAHAVVQFKP
jgi:hypothetical protein